MKTVGKTFPDANQPINSDFKINLQKGEGDPEESTAVPSDPDNKQGQEKDKKGKGAK